MAGKSPAEAVSNYIEPLQRALSCVTNAILVVSPRGYESSDRPHLATLSGGTPIRLRGPRGLHLGASQQYRIVAGTGERGPWKVETAAYLYELLGDDEREFLVYHWHPEGLSDRRRPHLHIAGMERKRHLPTGRVALEDVLRLCLEDLEVEPFRDDWDEILEESQSAFETWRTWG